MAAKDNRSSFGPPEQKVAVAAKMVAKQRLRAATEEKAALKEKLTAAIKAAPGSQSRADEKMGCNREQRRL